MFSVNFNNADYEPYWFICECPWQALAIAASLRSYVVYNGKTIWSATDGN